MSLDPGGLPRRQRVAAYAVIVRGGDVLLSRLAPSISEEELWTLPGGGIEFGEHPDAAVVREVYEETGLRLPCSAARCGSGPPTGSSTGRASRPSCTPSGSCTTRGCAADAPEPRVVEVDGSTIDARWVPVADVESGSVPTVPMVREALAHHRPAVKQRVVGVRPRPARRRAPAHPQLGCVGPDPGPGRSRAAGSTTARRRRRPSRVR